MIGEVSPHVDRRLLVAGAGLAGAVLGWVLLVTVFGGSGGRAEVAPSRPPAPVAAGPKPAPSSTPAVTYVPPSRDPFHQNVTVPRAPGPGQAPVQGAGAASTPTTRPPRHANDRASLELKSIAPDGAGTVRATITVDGQPYTPAKGETFSHGYRLERIEGSCVEVSAQSARAPMCLPTTRA